MGLLDSYHQQVDNECAEVAKNNSTLEKLASATGLGPVVDGVKSQLSTGLIESAKTSPLRVLGEDVLAQAITDTSRRLSQNITNVVTNAIGPKALSSLQTLRSLAFDSVVAVMAFQNDMTLYFAGVVAKEAIKAIREKRENLLEMKEAIMKLHNALMVLTGGGPFFNKYLADLRTALEKIDSAQIQLGIVHSAFASTLSFPKSNYQLAKNLLDEAYVLIMPPVTGKEAETLRGGSAKGGLIGGGLLKGVFAAPKYEEQLAMLILIPKLTMKMLKTYDLYVIKVLKVNLLLLGFQNCVQNLKAITGNQITGSVLTMLETNRSMLQDIVESMALQLNGDVQAIKGPINIETTTTVNALGFSTGVSTKPYVPSPTKTSALAVEWSVRVKACRLMLEALAPDSLQHLSLSNQALQHYNDAILALSKLDDRRAFTAILHATDGRESVGDIEADFITFAFQANQALIDSAMTKKEDGLFGPKTVIALGNKLTSRVQLSIDQDKEIELILQSFVEATGPLLKAIQAVGNSIFKLLDDLHMDAASDALKGGLFEKFFKMDSKTATYVGAAAAGLSLVQNLLQDESQKQCLQKAVDKLKVQETSKQLSGTRAVSANYVRQQVANDKKCADQKQEAAKVDACSSQLDLNLLKANPGKSLSGMFNGVFGGSISDSLPFTENLFPSPKTAKDLAMEAADMSNKQEDVARSNMVDALKKSGVKADMTDSTAALKAKMAEVAPTAKGLAKEALEKAGISSKVSDSLKKTYDIAKKKQKATPDFWSNMNA